MDRSVDNLNNRITSDELEYVIKTLIENDAVLKNNISSNEAKAHNTINPDGRICGVGMSTMCMIANGDIYPCAGWQKYICGNLKNSSLRQIWENSSEIKYLRKLRQRDFTQCLECENADYCQMCIARNSNEDTEGNIFSIPEITCEAVGVYNKILTQYMQIA